MPGTLEQLKQKLLILTYIHSYRSGTFTLSSGRTSSYYIDGKQVTMTPEGLHTAARYILASLRHRRIVADAIGGPTLGADPIAAAVTALSKTGPAEDGSPGAPAPLSSFIVRKEAKKHGTGSRVAGPFYRGMRTIIVDDVLTTGASVLDAAAAVEEEGGSVSAIYLLVDRLEGGREAVEKAGYLLEAAIDRRSLEKLQQELEQRYPDLSRSLQAVKVPWGELPLGELEPDYPALAAALADLAGAVKRAASGGRLTGEQPQQAADKALSAVKAALYHPGGEAEALRLVRQIRGALA